MKGIARQVLLLIGRRGSEDRGELDTRSSCMNMKQTKQCPKCKSLKIGYLESQPDSTGPDASRADRAEPRMAGMVARRGGSYFLATGGWVKHEGVGALAAFVCTECGYFESYVRNPARVPWNDMKGFHWVNAKPEAKKGPYR